MCQLTNRLTEHKYYGTYQQLAQTIKKYSSAPMLDVQRYWEMVLFSWMTGNSDMHCKNFSLIDTGNGEYVLSPAYDLLAVLLADPADTEEMAMSFSVGGEKSGFNRNTFMAAFTESGISVVIAEKMIERMKGCIPKWKELINLSFLPEEMKIDYCTLLDKRKKFWISSRIKKRCCFEQHRLFLFLILLLVEEEIVIASGIVGPDVFD